MFQIWVNLAIPLCMEEVAVTQIKQFSGEWLKDNV